MTVSKIALGKRLRSCPSFKSLGIQIDPEKYTLDYFHLIKKQTKIYYPTHLYEDVFLALGKEVFPRNFYRYMGNKIKQTELFQFLDIPHPETRIYYGPGKKSQILLDFPFPFVAKIPVGSSQGKGVFLIENESALESYLKNVNPAYIQEYLQISKDLRVVLVGKKVVHAYWRIAEKGEFRHNVSQGARISFEKIPEGALQFAVDVAEKCDFDEVGLDICRLDGKFYVLEANMVFGVEGFKMVNKNIYTILRDLAEESLI